MAEGSSAFPFLSLPVDMRNAVYDELESTTSITTVFLRAHNDPAKSDSPYEFATGFWYRENMDEPRCLHPERFIQLGEMVCDLEDLCSQDFCSNGIQLLWINRQIRHEAIHSFMSRIDFQKDDLSPPDAFKTMIFGAALMPKLALGCISRFTFCWMHAIVDITLKMHASGFAFTDLMPALSQLTIETSAHGHSRGIHRTCVDLFPYRFPCQVDHYGPEYLATWLIQTPIGQWLCGNRNLETLNLNLELKGSAVSDLSKTQRKEVAVFLHEKFAKIVCKEPRAVSITKIYHWKGFEEEDHERITVSNKPGLKFEEGGSVALPDTPSIFDEFSPRSRLM